eukprot:TRINITY_DN38398_c0_g1_i3.p1 TRINITY_DN38398_c0_g1~~TRINITY_DN38398_c0_g1_i3.p1  ORF type:complete len:168 (+),score=10.18 TRINITY_DN38398_c0_g1_i3:65-568(+)
MTANKYYLYRASLLFKAYGPSIPNIKCTAEASMWSINDNNNPNEEKEEEEEKKCRKGELSWQSRLRFSHSNSNSRHHHPRQQPADCNTQSPRASFSDSQSDEDDDVEVFTRKCRSWFSCCRRRTNLELDGRQNFYYDIPISGEALAVAVYGILVPFVHKSTLNSQKE